MLGVADPQAQGGGGAVSAAQGARRPTRWRSTPPPAPGFDGAAVLDAQGRLAGLCRSSRPWSPAPRRAANAALMPVEAVRALLDAQNVTPARTAVPAPTPRRPRWCG